MSLEGKNIFITGATGFVGGYITKALYEQKANIYALNGKQNDKSFLGDISNNITWLDVDLLDPNGLIEVLKDIEYVVHTASIVSFNNTLDELRAININGTANLVNISLQANVKKFIHISSIAALGNPEYGVNINENSKWSGDKGMSAYAISKYNAEQEVWRGYREGLDVVILNPSVILGVGDWNRSSLTIFKLLKSGVKYYPTGVFSSVDIRDVVTATLQSFNENISGERFILNAGSIPYKDALTIISNGLDVTPPTKQVSKSYVMFVYYLEKFISLISSRSRKLSKNLINTLFSPFVYENNKVIDSMNIQFKSLEETMNWVKEDHK
ncbi:NAD-dependent epimerase/dehydratase family protein [Flammeovirga agarivorans]|uniref:NAD-dependent epimerase/dehydratase family protein n=1 Tax=Flammeovirga agarivorans TaxID=2726742 RepID=A0A7X8XX38_9BACT|nr:NAD-dependent epimerase/dehydratase family protein [Flammeovirga agarivorans]NLR92839.1 NAD-dependent epimerase/dehydratase family protein [Flammeovirga agarivorans]